MSPGTSDARLCYKEQHLDTLSPSLGLSAVIVVWAPPPAINPALRARSLRSTATHTEKRSNFNVSLRLREGECRVAITITTKCRVHVQARCSQQRRDNLGVGRVAPSRRSRERRLAITSCRVHPFEARRSQQHRDRLGVAMNRRRRGRHRQCQ